MLDPNKEFGSAVRVARVKFNLTQVELAEKLSTTDRTVSKIETGKTNPRLDTVAHFSKELHISLDAIIHQSKETGMSIPYCVQMYFAGMDEMRARQYIAFCEQIDSFIK